MWSCWLRTLRWMAFSAMHCGSMAACASTLYTL
jgi:hypothetical protein